MTIPFDFLIDIWNIFLLVLVRISGMFYLSPIFGRRNVPNHYKAGFCFLFSVIVANSVPVPDLSSYQTLFSYVVLIGKELLIGLMMGFISYLIFSCIYIAGHLIDMRIGFGMVSVYDPMTNIQVPVTADFYAIFATLLPPDFGCGGKLLHSSHRRGNIQRCSAKAGSRSLFGGFCHWI